MKLFVVATPIGNLQDISPRAKQVLAEVDLIAAEDTRHSAILLQHLGINTPLIAYHDHNEQQASVGLIDKILAGTSVALISDAGTPLISDPGYRLVQLAHEKGVGVIPIPGPSALITALSASGLATDRFLFIGFLPAKAEARKRALEEVAQQGATLVCYESRHRITASLETMVAVLGAERQACIGRELTKKFEQLCFGRLGDLLEQLRRGDIVAKGEFVVMVEGVAAQAADYEHVQLMQALLAELPPRKAASVASNLTGVAKKVFYDLSIELKGEKKD
ncbi:MAG: 16S rRNA (cytidine(1402)-2'-O)-methyltransferase [Pseudomonadales bacterium]